MIKTGIDGVAGLDGLEGEKGDKGEACIALPTGRGEKGDRGYPGQFKIICIKKKNIFINKIE